LPAGKPVCQEHHLFFFSSRRRHTRWPRDWSSDVCSSDLSADGALVRLKDVGRSELGAESYTTDLRYNAHDSVGFGVLQLPTANRSEERRVGKECISRGEVDH